MNAPAKFDTGRMTSKGQIFVPKATREAVGLVPNAPYKLAVDEQNRLVVTPLGLGPEDAEERVRRMRDGLKMLTGISRDGRGTDAIMREVRGDREP